MEKVQNLFHTTFMRIDKMCIVARHHLSERKATDRIRILSFGSSIGDELATLRAFFPQAEILGCDIDPVLLERAGQSIGRNAGIRVFLSDCDSIRQHGPYDLIVASAVLCLNPAPANYAVAFPFSQFEDIISTLDSALRPGGLMAILNAGYRLQDCAIAQGYRPVRSDLIDRNGFVSVMNADGSPYLSQVNGYGDFLYCRHGDLSRRDDEDLADALFEKTDPATPAAAGRPHVLRPRPEGMIETSSFVRNNTDYLPGPPPANVLRVSRHFRTYSDTSGAPAGYTIETSRQSVTGEGMYSRGFDVWHPLSV